MMTTCLWAVRENCPRGGFRVHLDCSGSSPDARPAAVRASASYPPRPSPGQSERSCPSPGGVDSRSPAVKRGKALILPCISPPAIPRRTGRNGDGDVCDDNEHGDSRPWCAPVRFVQTVSYKRTRARGEARWGSHAGRAKTGLARGVDVGQLRWRRKGEGRCRRSRFRETQKGRPGSRFVRERGTGRCGAC